MKKFTIFVVLLFSLLGYNANAQVTITAPNLNNLCVGVSSYTNLGNIVLAETAISDVALSAGGILVLTMPTGFELNAGVGTISASGGGDVVINGASTINATNISINYTADATLLNSITISGLQARAIAPAGSGDMLFGVASTGVVAGMVASVSVTASFTSVNLPALPTITAGNTQSFCVGTVAASTYIVATGVGTVRWYSDVALTTQVTAITSPSLTNLGISTVAASSNTFYVISDNGTCKSAAVTVNVNITALPASPAITGGSPKSYCVGTVAGTTTINATGAATIRWYSDIALATQVTTGTSATLTTLGISTAVASSATFYLVSDDGVCKSILTPLVVNITALPALNVFASATPICVGNTVSFVASASGIGVQYQFELKKGGVSQAIQAYSGTPFYITSNTLIAGNDYTMEVLAKDASNCVSVLSDTPFTVLANPTAPTIAFASVAYCVGTNLATQNLTATGITGGNTVDWFSDASLSVLLATGGTITPASLGISSAIPNAYTRYFTQKNANCRSAATLLTISISPNPVVSLSSNQPASNMICEEDAINYTASGTGGLMYSFQLMQVFPSVSIIQTTVSSLSNTYTIPINLTVGSYNVRVTGVNGAGCQSIANITNFSVLAKPVVNFPVPSPSSFIDTQTTPVVLSATPVDGVGGVGVFSGPGVVGNNFYPNASGGAGSKTITYTFTATNGCKDSKSIVLTINTGGFFVAQGYCQDAGLSALTIPGFCPTAVITDLLVYFPASPATIQIAGSYFFNPSAVPIAAGQDFTLWEGAVFAPVCAPFYYYIVTRVFRPAAPVISISTGNNPACKDDIVTYTTPAHAFTTATGNTTYNWTFDTSGSLVAGTILSGQGTNTVTVRWNNVGSAKLQVSQTINYTSPIVTSCSKTVDFSVTVNPLPTSVITPSVGGNVCQGSTITYSTDFNAGHTYIWSVSNGTVLANPTVNSIQIKWNDVGTFAVGGQVSVARTITATGCQATHNLNVTLQPLPNPVFSAGAASVCIGDVGKVYTVAPNVAGHTYTWSISPVGAGTITAGVGTSSITVTWNTNGVAVLQLIQTNNTTLCERTITSNVQVNLLPGNNITSTTSGLVNVCEDSDHAYQTPNSPFFNYVWTVTNGAIVGVSTADKVNVKWASGVLTGTLNLVKTNVLTNCSNTNSVVVNIRALPTPIVTGASPICALTSNVYSTALVGGSTYFWEVTDTNGNPVPFVQANNQVTLTWGTTVTGRVKVTQTNAATCVASDNKNIAINPLPIPFILGSNQACANTGGVNYITPNVAGNAYNWAVSGGTITAGAGTNAIIVTWNSAGAGLLTLTETSPTTCFKTVNQAVAIHPLPAPAITGASTVCQSKTGESYSVPNVAGHTYQWMVIGGNIFSGNGTNAITVNWGTGASGTVSVQERDGNYPITNCLASDTKSITINPLPTPAIVGTTIVCAGASAQTYTTTAVTGHTYLWSVVGGVISGSNTSNSVIVNWGNNPAGAQLQVVQTDANFSTNCSTTNVLPILIQPLPSPNITPATNTCLGSTAIYSTPLGGSAYLWSVTNGAITTGQGTNTITVKWNDIGVNGSIQVVQTISSSCNNTDLKTINFHPLPTPVVMGNASSCELAATALVYTTSNNVGSTYLWAVTGGTASASAQPYEINVVWGTNGIGTVKVTETNSNMCVGSNTKTVVINKLPNPDITPKTAVCELSKAFYQTTLNAGATYVWSVSTNPGTKPNTYTVTNPVNFPNVVRIDWGDASSAILTVEETDVNGCKKITNQPITIHPLPAPSIDGLAEVCENQTTVTYSTPNIGGNVYEWYVIDGSIIGSNTTNSIIVNWETYAVSGGTGAVYVEQKNTATTCLGYHNVLVTIRPSPNAIIAGDTTVCALTNAEVYSVPAVSGHTYLWTVVGGTITSSTTTNSITIDWGSNPLGASVEVLQKDGNFATNCSKIFQRDITIFPLPTPAITPTNAACEEAIDVLYQTNFVANTTYTWIVTGGTMTTVAGNPNQIKITWGLASAVAGGIGIIRVKEVNNVTGCEKEITQNIQLYAKPTPSISPITDVCELTNNTYQTGNTGGSTFFWSVTGGIITGGQSTNQINVSWNATDVAGTLSTRVVTVRETNFNGCIKAITQNIIVQPRPAPAIVGSAEVCALQTATSYQTANVAGNTYVWTVAGGTVAGSATSSTVLVDWGSNPIGTSLQVIETISATGCIKVTSRPIIIRALPTPVITGDIAACASSAGIVYQVNNVANNSYVWSVSNPIKNIIAPGQNTNSITIDWGDIAGNNTVTVVQTDNNFTTNCATTKVLNVTVLPLPTPAITGDLVNVCASEIGVANTPNFFEATYTTPLTANSSYVWVVSNNGVIVSGQLSNQIKVRWTDPSQTTPINVTTGTVKVTQETTSPVPFCVASDTKTVTINRLPITNFSINNLCFGEITTFAPTMTDATWTWSWIFSEGSPSAAQAPSFVFNTLGLKTVSLLVIGGNGCEYRSNKTFTIHPVPVAKFTYAGACKNAVLSNTQFTDASTIAFPDNIATWAWTFGDGGTSTLQNPLHQYTTEGVYDATLIVKSNNNCSNTYIQKVRIYPTFQPTTLVPYLQNFESVANGWLAYGDNNTWQRGIPIAGRTIQSAGDNIWTTGLNANYSDNQKSYVESPCFDLSLLDKPMISLDTWVDSDAGNDGATMHYTINDGRTWVLLGETEKGINWYNTKNVLGFSVDATNPNRQGWAGKLGSWLSVRYSLDAVKQAAVANTVRFRIAFGSNSDNTAGTFDGFAFDDVFIGNRQTAPLIEHFTSMNSSIVAGVDIQAETNAVDALSSEAVKLQYYTNLADTPTLADRLFKDNTADPTARALLYGLNIVPRASVNGKVNRNQIFTAWGSAEVDRQLLTTPVFDMKVLFTPTPADKINISVNVVPKMNYAKDVVLHIVLVENQISSAQLGLTGTTIYKNVVKKMLPSAAGKAIRTTWTMGVPQNFTQTVTPYALSQSTPLAPKFYDWNNLKVVAFIQDFETNAVLQATEANPTSIPSPVTALADDGQGEVRMYPNPAQNQVFIGFEETAFRTYNWELQTLQGQPISSGIIQKGQQGVTIDTSKYPSGMYIMRVIHPQTKAAWTSKLVIKK